MNHYCYQRYITIQSEDLCRLLDPWFLLLPYKVFYLTSNHQTTGHKNSFWMVNKMSLDLLTPGSYSHRVKKCSTFLLMATISHHDTRTLFTLLYLKHA